MSYGPILRFARSLSVDPSADSSNTGAQDHPSPKSFSVQFQTPTNADSSSPNHAGLYGAIAGIAVLVLIFVAWEFYRMRRRAQKFKQTDVEAAMPVYYGRRDEKGGFMPPPSELPPPPPAYYSSSYVQRPSPPAYPSGRV